MPFDSNQPFNDLPLLPPSKNLETIPILKLAIQANKELAELKTYGMLLPNQSVLMQALGMQEAKLSSEIENIVTTNDELYRALADKGVTQNNQTKEVLFYKDALWFGFNHLKRNKPITTVLLEEMVKIITQTEVGVRKTSGTKLVHPKSGKTIYTPPVGENLIRDKLANLEKYIYTNDGLDPLIKLAVLHYQFEAIHPFNDGNGRVGRILNVLFLIEQKLLSEPILYLSRYIFDNKAAYYIGLKDVTEKGKWEEWIIYILEGIRYTAQLTKDKILKIHQLMKESMDLVKEKLPNIYSKDLLLTIYQQPYCKISFMEEAKLAKRQTASKYLQELEKIGLFRSVKVGREIYYVNDAFLKILTT